MHPATSPYLIRVPSRHRDSGQLAVKTDSTKLVLWMVHPQILSLWDAEIFGRLRFWMLKPS